MAEQIVKAVYEKGALYLLEPLELQEHQQVRVQVLTENPSEGKSDEDMQALQVLIAAGLIEPKSKSPAPPDPISAEERQVLADRLGKVSGKSTSEMVIEDRGELGAI